MSKIDLYKGPSDGFKSLVEGYIAYAEETIANRSVPDLRDGLKPVSRRTMFMLEKSAKNKIEKSIKIVGDVLKIHPHGDSSVYQSLCGMTDASESLLVPLVTGQGAFGKVYSKDAPAASRYTGVQLGPHGKYFFKDKEAMTMVEGEIDTDSLEPDALPIIYPYVLLSGAMGLAVGVATKIPSFNFWDVLGLLEEHVTKETMETIIYPDYPTGGHYIRNDAEMARVMNSGRGVIKLRSDVEITGKEIFINEVTYGQSVEALTKKIKDLELPGVANVIDMTGYTTGAQVLVTCRSAKVVEEVYMQLLNQNILQTNIHSNMLTIENKVPHIGGVYSVIKKWTRWRKRIIKKSLTMQYEALDSEIETLGYFIRLISNDEWRLEYTDKLINSSTNGPATTYIYSLDGFAAMPSDVNKWILDRRAIHFRKEGEYRDKYNQLVQARNEVTADLNNIDGVILRDIAMLRAECKGMYARKTKISDTDYRFSRVEEIEKVYDGDAWFHIYDNGYLRKTKSPENPDQKGLLKVVPAQANSTLVGFDKSGRVHRIYGEHVEYVSTGDRGIYMGAYLDLPNDESSEIIYMGLLDGTTRTLIYNDGYIGFFDTSIYMDAKQKTRTIQRGVNEMVGKNLLDVWEESENKPYLFALDVRQGVHGNFRYGMANLMDTMKKSNRGRTKILGGTDIVVDYVTGWSELEMLSSSTNPGTFAGRVKLAPKDLEFLGVDSVGEFFNEHTYRTAPTSEVN